VLTKWHFSTGLFLSISIIMLSTLIPNSYGQSGVVLDPPPPEFKAGELVTISGQVTDSAGIQLANQTVYLKDDISGGIADTVFFSTITDSNGYFSKQFSFSTENWYEKSVVFLYASTIKEDYRDTDYTKSEIFRITIHRDLFLKTKEFSKIESFVMEPNAVLEKFVKVKTPYDRIDYLILVTGDKEDAIVYVLKSDSNSGLPLDGKISQEYPNYGLKSVELGSYFDVKNNVIFVFDNANPEINYNSSKKITFAYTVETFDKQTETWIDATDQGLGMGQITEEKFPIEYIIIVIATIVVTSAAILYLKKSKKPKIPKQGDVSKPKFCRKCGSPLSKKDKFCGKCGKSF